MQRRELKSHNKTISEHLADKMQRIRINNEINFWYKKKQILNEQLYNSYLENNKKRGKIWDLIDQHISHKLETK
jgi:hypothetical protein